MNLRSFLLLLAVTTAFVLLLNLLLGQFFGTFVQYRDVMGWSLTLFIPLSIGMFFLGKRVANSENKMLFHNLIIGTIFIKMFLSIFGVLIYKEAFQPETKNFTFPFFIVYFSFTIFETYFMVKIGKMKSEN